MASLYWIRSQMTLWMTVTLYTWLRLRPCGSMTQFIPSRLHIPSLFSTPRRVDKITLKPRMLYSKTGTQTMAIGGLGTLTCMWLEQMIRLTETLNDTTDLTWTLMKHLACVVSIQMKWIDVITMWPLYVKYMELCTATNSVSLMCKYKI